MATIGQIWLGKKSYYNYGMWGFQKYDFYENPFVNKKVYLVNKPCVNANYGQFEANLAGKKIIL